MKILKPISAAVLGIALTAVVASAATLTLSIPVGSVTSTSITCPLSTYTAPLAAGSTICTITVAPATWTGTLALSGANSASFTIGGLSGNTATLMVGPTALAAATYTVTITSTP